MIHVRGAARLAAGLVLSASAVAYAQPPPPVTVPTPAGDVTVVADRLEESGPERLLIATGNVEITRGTSRLLADRVEVNRDTGDAVATGNVIFYDGENRLSGARIDYNFHTGTGVVHDAEARTEPYYRLRAERLERIGESVYRVRRGVFTTCEADPPPWSVRFGRATVDLERAVTGRDASFWVRNFPLIPWLPYFAAAIRTERQTGFLFPRVGHSSSKGFSTEIPFFWAISDSQDLTLAPLGFTNRGPGLNADYRYVLSAGNRGGVKGFYLRETERHDDDRGWFAFRQDWSIGAGLSFKADVRAVTDDRLLRDYGDGLHQRSEQRAESNVFLTRRWATWDLVGSAFSYQDLTTRRPVELRRLPELTLQSVRQPVPGMTRLLYDVESSATRFVREVGSDGTRADVHPRLSLPLSPDGLVTLTPFAGGRLTAYDRRVIGSRVSRDRTVEVTEEAARLRPMMEAGSDLASTASRVYRLDGVQGLDAVLHTIEPRLRYIWIDGRNQDRLPAWTDLDRIRDASRFEYSLTNRVRGKTISGATSAAVRLELIRFVLGHSVDLKDPRGDSGEAFADLILQPIRELSFRGDLRQDTHGDGVTRATTDLAVTLDRATAGVGTRYSPREKLNFLQGVLTGEITTNLHARLQTNWDLRTDHFVENRFAIDLRFQCYAFTIEYVDRSGRGRAGEDEIRFAVNLLGLGAPIQTSMGVGSLTSSGGTSSR